MRRILFGLLLSALTLSMASAQTPQVVKEVDDQLKSLRLQDEPLRSVLATHPDVLVAQAKVRVAEAELAQVKMVLTQKFNALKSDIETQKLQLNAQESLLDQMKKSGQAVAQSELLPVQTKVTEAKSKLSRLTSELQGMSGTKTDPNTTNYSVPLAMLDTTGKPISDLREHILRREPFMNPAPGSAADKLISGIDTPVYYSANGKPVPDAVKELKEKWRLDIMVRVSSSNVEVIWARSVLNSVSAVMTFPGWIDFVLEEINSKTLDEKDLIDVYVREYGLLVCFRNKSPQDAITLREFARQVRAEKTKPELKK